MWMPEEYKPYIPTIEAVAGGAVAAGGNDEHKPKTPPPDLPSLLLDSRIVYLGMPVSNAFLSIVHPFCMTRHGS
jgi:hypothetical protein